MEKLSDEIKIFILEQLDRGNYTLEGGDLIINLIPKKEQRDNKNIYQLKSGKWNVKIQNPKTKKKVNVGTYDTKEEARRARDKFIRENSPGIIKLESFRKAD